eukprot:3121311-Alexandrium_andersonii.AAC.1
MYGSQAVQQERIIQLSVEVPLAAKEIVHVSKIIPQGRGRGRGPLGQERLRPRRGRPEEPRLHREQQECIIQQAVEQVVMAPIPMTQEEVVHEDTLKYDSIHGRLDDTVELDGDSLVIDGKK